MTVGIVMVALLSSCSGSRTVSAPEPPQRADASVAIALQADGQASMSLTLSRFDPITTPALARRVAHLAFPGSDAVTVDDDRSTGHTVALRVGSAFTRGRPASYRFPGAPLFTAFREGGFSTGDLHPLLAGRARGGAQRGQGDAGRRLPAVVGERDRA